MDGRTEIRTDRPSPDGSPTSTGRPKDERDERDKERGFKKKIYRFVASIKSTKIYAQMHLDGQPTNTGKAKDERSKVRVSKKFETILFKDMIINKGMWGVFQREFLMIYSNS